MKRPLILLCAALLIPVAALTVLPPAPACRLQVIPDYVTPISFIAVLRPSSGCPYGTVLRVRKSSTLNTKRDGAKVQPIKPLVGAWEVGQLVPVKTPVPKNELVTNTLTRWRWEYYDAAVWNDRTSTRGRWLAGEVLHAAP